MVLCGPTADTATLKVNAEVRVYEQQHADRGYTIHACVPGGRPFKLGDKQIVSLRIGGHYVAVIRRGETLHVYDVRKRRRVGQAARAIRFTQYRLTRSGTVAYLADTPYGQVTGETDEGATFPVTADPYYLRFAGGALATRYRGEVHIQGLDTWTDDGLLAVVGKIRIDTFRGRLRARLGARKPMFIGTPFSPCSSHTDCGEGVSLLQFARDRYVVTNGATVYDLARRVERRCEDVPAICATG